jgi:hypothetical protein
MKNGSCSVTTLPGGAALSFVISTEAKRSGEICGLAVPSWKCFSTEESWGLRPTQGDEKNGFCSATNLPGSAALPFVISTEAKRSGEISVWMLSLGKVFDGVYPDFLLRGASDDYVCGSPLREPHADHQSQVLTGNPGERSGEICGSGALSWRCSSSERSVPEGPAVFSTYSHTLKTIKAITNKRAILLYGRWLAVPVGLT